MIKNNVIAFVVIASVIVLGMFVASTSSAASIFYDDVGDAVTGTTQSGILGIDVERVELDVRSDTVELRIVFGEAQEISAPSSNDSSSLFGVVSFELDNDNQTGISPSFVDVLGSRIGHPFSGLSADAEIGISEERDTPGQAPFQQGLATDVLIPVSFTDSVATITIPRDLFPSMQPVSITVGVGDSTGPTDIAGPFVFTVPEPSSLALLAILVFTFSAYGRKSRSLHLDSSQCSGYVV